MSGSVGTVVRGVRAPIIRNGDNLAEIIVNSVMAASKECNAPFGTKDVVSVTEAVVARAQGNYASVDDIANDIRSKFPTGHVGVVFPILSRNRFSMCLKGIARGSKKITVMLSYPADEVGNHLIDLQKLDDVNINPWVDVLSETKYRELFGNTLHTFTGVDYVAYYRSIIEGEGAKAEFVFANKAQEILNYTKDILCCDIHTRQRTKRILKDSGAEHVYGLDDIMNTPGKTGGYNDEYGILGSNKATEETVKLFPRDCVSFVKNVQRLFKEKAGVNIEVMIYGDGAFKDPVGKIWELADPIVSPGFTDGLIGLPNEIKLKYLADNDFADLNGEELRAAIIKHIKEKNSDLKGNMESQGTTPRRITDLLGSLSDLTSGSGDKGTPIVWIQNYFNNYAD
ncbi:MAG: coenzyme F420-0:L-glutamate ligase [Oscillospiraceae bacterium]